MPTQITTTVELDDSIVQIMSKAFLLESTDRIVIDQFVSIAERNALGKFILPVYSKLAKATTPLTEDADLDGVKITDTAIELVPKEFGNVVTRTKLANLLTGGRADLGASAVVAQNMVESLNTVGINALKAGVNILVANGKSAKAELTPADVIQDEDLRYVQNQLHRNNVAKFDGDLYVAIAHPDVVDCVAKLDGWRELQKYADAVQVLKNEVGAYGGFRWISTTGNEIDAESGAEDADTYNTVFIGRNALGRAIAQDPDLMITGPFDKLGRFLNIGWYGVLEYEIADPACSWQILSGSNIGVTEEEAGGET